jgi:photosystem II stability/assembly factor-like uncharacterized protein
VISRRLLGLNDLTMVDANTAWIVGTDGGIGYTTNSGIDWVLQKTGTAVNLTSVSFVDAAQGWVVGTAGTLLHTTDSGTTWTPLEGIKGVFTLDGIDFVSATTGWTVSDTGGVYMSSDGGVSWTKQESNTKQDLIDIVMLDDGQNGWAVGWSGTIIHTADAGATWTEQNSGVAGILNSVWFIDANIGAQQTSNTTADLIGIFFFDAQNGWAVGSKNTIMNTTDGGTTWTQQKTSTASDAIRAVVFTSLDSGLSAGSGGHIWKWGTKLEE